MTWNRDSTTGASAMAQVNAVLDCIDHAIAAIGRERELATLTRDRLVADVKKLYDKADALRLELAEEIKDYRRTERERWGDLEEVATEPTHAPYGMPPGDDRLLHGIHREVR